MSIGRGWFFFLKMKLIPHNNAYIDVSIKHRPIGPDLYSNISDAGDPKLKELGSRGDTSD